MTGSLHPAWLLAAAVVFGAAIAVARRVARALGLVARPNPIVRSHRAPVPYLGGTALVLAWLALLAGSWAIAGGAPARDVVARAAVALAFVLFGTWDDAKPMGPWFKLIAQSLLCGTYLLAIWTPLGPGFAFKLLVLVTLANAYNIIDVMDGLLCLVCGIAVVSLLATPGLSPGHLVPELALMLVGVAVLFLFNCPPARVYAGDAGALTLGFLVGAWGLAAAGDAGGLEALPIAGLWAIPLLELALVVPARILQGRSPLRGSPDHFSLRLQDQGGWSKWRVLAVSTVLGAGFAAAPWVMSGSPPAIATAYTLGSLLVAGIAWLLVWRIPPRPAPTPTPLRSP